MPTPDDYANNQPGANWRNFNPPPTTPGVFTVANPYGQRPDPSRTTESSTRDGNPQATQVAQAPPPTPADAAPPALTPQQKTYYDAHIAGHPGEMSEAEYAQYLARQNAGNIAAANAVGRPQDAAGLTPVSAAPPPEPAAKPLPNLGAWTPDQAAPWMHVKPIAPQQVPDRPPDTHVGTRPAYHPRPTEAGYTPPIHQPGQPYSFSEQLGFALQAGFTGPAAYTAAALGMAESKGNAGIVHYNDGGKGFNSYGLMQINGSNDAVLRQAGINGAAAAVDPLTSYKAAYVLSKGGTDFSPWSTFNDHSYLRYLDGNARPEASSTLAVGQRQEYRQPQPRESREWGRTPERDWTPGNMPTAHDIPGIMGGMLPLVLTLFAGAAMGGGLGMVAAFAGYQTARNKGQQEAAKEAKNQWKNHLEETASKLQEEAIGASGIVAEFGYDLSNPQALARWQELAGNFDDRQLSAAIGNGDSGAIERLFKNRDMAFQTLKKTSDAQNKADEQQSEKDAGVGAEQSPSPGQEDNPPPAGLPGERPRPAAPPGQGGWLQPPGAGGPAAGAPAPGSAAPPSPHAAATPSPEEPPASEPEPQPSPAGGLVRPAAWSGPPVAAPSQGGDPVVQPGDPDALPDVGVGGLAPWPKTGPLSQGVTGLSPDRLDQDARQYLETGRPVYHGGPSGDPLAIYRNEAVARRAAQMQSFIDRTIRETKPGDIEGAFQKLDTIDPGLASIARSVDHGDMAPPSGWQLRVPLYQNVQKLVTALDPTWDATRWVTNYRTKTAYTTGTQSVQIASVNRALQHMTVLMDAAKQLGNTNSTDWNGLVNLVRTHLGSDAATNFIAARAAVARELERAFRGGSGAYAEIKQDLDNVSASGSPAQILGYIRTTTELLKGQLDALADLYQRGTRKPTTGDDLLSPEARNVYHRILKTPLEGSVPDGEPPPAELDSTATMPPSPMSGPGPAPSEMPPGWTEQQ